MLVYNEVYPYIKKKIDELNDYIKTKKYVSGFFDIHGTFSTGFKGVSENVQYISDIDAELWLRYKNKKNSSKFILELIDYLLKNNFYLEHVIAGINANFVFPFKVKKNGLIIDYYPDKIIKKLKLNYKNKLLTKEELDNIIKYVIDEPTLISIELLKLSLEKYKLLKWSKEELQNGYKNNIKFEDIILENVIMTSFIYEYKEGNYLTFELNIHNYEISDKYNSTSLNNIQKYAKLYGEYDRTTNIFNYETIFKNYVQLKYLKVLKRLRSLLTSYMYKEYNKNTVNNTYEKLTNFQYKRTVKNLRHGIRTVIFKKRISCLNQLKTSINIIIVLMQYKSELEIKRLTLNSLKNLLLVCNYSSKKILDIYSYLNSGKYETDKMKELLTSLKKEVFSFLNNLVLPDLIYYYKEIESLVPFKLQLPVNLYDFS